MKTLQSLAIPLCVGLSLLASGIKAALSADGGHARLALGRV